MISDLFTTILDVFQKYRKEKVGHDSDMMYIRKRQIFHQHIPDLDTIRRITGSRFDELQAIVNQFDPVNTEKLSDNPRKYELLTKTIIYKLPKQGSKEALADMVYVEFSLWFKHEYHHFKNKEAFINEIYSFKELNFRSDPFESVRKG